jgi:hypothetical protein
MPGLTNNTKIAMKKNGMQKLKNLKGIINISRWVNMAINIKIIIKYISIINMSMNINTISITYISKVKKYINIITYILKKNKNIVTTTIRTLSITKNTKFHITRNNNTIIFIVKKLLKMENPITFHINTWIMFGLVNKANTWTKIRGKKKLKNQVDIKKLLVHIKRIMILIVFNKRNTLEKLILT